MGIGRFFRWGKAWGLSLGFALLRRRGLGLGFGLGLGLLLGRGSGFGHESIEGGGERGHGGFTFRLGFRFSLRVRA